MNIIFSIHNWKGNKFVHVHFSCKCHINWGKFHTHFFGKISLFLETIPKFNYLKILIRNLKCYFWEICQKLNSCNVHFTFFMRIGTSLSSGDTIFFIFLGFLYVKKAMSPLLTLIGSNFDPSRVLQLLSTTSEVGDGAYFNLRRQWVNFSYISFALLFELKKVYFLEYFLGHRK